MIKDYKKVQDAELSSWFSDNEEQNRDKRIRETIRYPLLKKQMGLDFLDTSEMTVADIGCGPFGGVSSILKCRSVDRIDPLMDEYAKQYPQHNGIAKKAEDIEDEFDRYNLIIITNALDHFENPRKVLDDIAHYTIAGTYVAMLHAIDNAYSHPHAAHEHNVNPEMIHQAFDSDFEFVWELDYTHDGLVYGWRKQAAHSFLARKCTGYD